MEILKVSDGDLLVVKIGGPKTSSYSRRQFVDEVKEWVKNRGLHNVQILVHETDEDSASISVLTVNDPFENTVLK